MKQFNVTIICQAWYKSTIEVPDNMTREEAMEYAREHIDEIPIDDGLNYITDSDSLDEENCNFR